MIASPEPPFTHFVSEGSYVWLCGPGQKLLVGPIEDVLDAMQLFLESGELPPREAH
jgi:hypothetical protein